MYLKLVAVGKLREDYLRQGVEEYRKRLGACCRFEMIEVKDEPLRKKGDSPAQREQILRREAERVLKSVAANTYLVLLDLEGQMVTSEQLADRISDLGLRGKSDITFAIGGSLGVGSALKQRADWRLALSPMTFTHQLTRLILMEQLYRAFTIIRNEPYHL
ncbi:MAG: 23S rRNA (pseudouridine(1915)-N(3))-methyltransferase RlmH [Firmicutes bacterium]|nr:23S rRNA (pseudouridine(1915)-N(3))-methyltransferase RlmH [Bacillota bacterium]